MYTVPLYGWTQVSRLYLPAEKSYYKKKDNFGHAIHFLPVGVKWKVVKVVHCPHSMDGHRSHVSIFLLKKVITKRRIILDMQFPNQPLGVKWKVVKVVHCPTLWMDTGLTVSIFLLKKVITKRRIILDMQFPNQPLGVKWKVVKVVHCHTLWMDTGLMSLSSC